MNLMDEKIWLNIPGYLNYQFCLETMELKSLARITPVTLRHIKEKILPFCKDLSGYYRCGLTNNGVLKTLKRSQIVWLVINGHLPNKPFIIDHINGNKIDDRIENLQVITQRENCRKGTVCQNKILPIGVWYDRSRNKYESKTSVNRKTIHLGRFNCPTAALIARLKFEHTLFEE